VGSNSRVEAGPFLTECAAELAMDQLYQEGLGVHPSPWEARYSTQGLLIGSRIRDRKKSGQVLAHTG